MAMRLYERPRKVFVTTQPNHSASSRNRTTFSSPARVTPIDQNARILLCSGTEQLLLPFLFFLLALHQGMVLNLLFQRNLDFAYPGHLFMVFYSTPSRASHAPSAASFSSSPCSRPCIEEPYAPPLCHCACTYAAGTHPAKKSDLQSPQLNLFLAARDFFDVLTAVLSERNVH